MLNIEEIKAIIPHRYPFLLIDRVVEMEVGKSVHAIKSVTATEPWFQGHFPEHNVMPGVLQIEAMAQAGAVSILSMEEHKGKIAFFSGIKEAKFRNSVYPGDRLDIFVEIVKMRKNYGIGKGKILSDGELCVEAEISFFIG
ncbi:MAG: 3-hydroxyacyl-ACP dehydratase FabZ [Peptostreptococcus porci]|nr:3-hydroxyacyl-ACP dehydratase FabZ [Peptostreptococcus porci]